MCFICSKCNIYRQNNRQVSDELNGIRTKIIEEYHMMVMKMVHLILRKVFSNTPQILWGDGFRCVPLNIVIFRLNWCGSIIHTLVSHQHYDVIKWKHFPRYWSFVRGIHRSPVNSSHKVPVTRFFMFSLTNDCTNNWGQVMLDAMMVIVTSL